MLQWMELMTKQFRTCQAACEVRIATINAWFLIALWKSKTMLLSFRQKMLFMIIFWSIFFFFCAVVFGWHVKGRLVATTDSHQVSYPNMQTGRHNKFGFFYLKICINAAFLLVCRFTALSVNDACSFIVGAMRYWHYGLIAKWLTCELNSTVCPICRCRHCHYGLASELNWFQMAARSAAVAPELNWIQLSVRYAAVGKAAGLLIYWHDIARQVIPEWQVVLVQISPGWQRGDDKLVWSSITLCIHLICSVKIIKDGNPNSGITLRR